MMQKHVTKAVMIRDDEDLGIEPISRVLVSCRDEKKEDTPHSKDTHQQPGNQNSQAAKKSPKNSSGMHVHLPDETAAQNQTTAAFKLNQNSSA